MIEAASSQTHQDAFRAAHEARAEAARALFKSIFTVKVFPLGRQVFTGSLRWA